MSRASQIVREIRESSGLSLRVLAERAGTSAATISDYEHGRREPKLSTLERLASVAGAELRTTVEPRFTPPELLALEIHRAVAAHLRTDPAVVLDLARRRLAWMRERDREGVTGDYHDAWEQLLAMPVEALISRMLSPEQVARDLRAVSPFTGILEASEREALVRASYGVSAHQIS